MCITWLAVVHLSVQWSRYFLKEINAQIEASSWEIDDLERQTGICKHFESRQAFNDSTLPSVYYMAALTKP